jgi:hypothetical protein
VSTNWRLIAGHEPGPLAWALLLLCIGVAVFEAVLPLLPAELRQRIGLAGGAGQGRRERRIAPAVFGLRLLAIAALVAMVLELGVRIETYTGTTRRVVVLVDHSPTARPDPSPAATRASASIGSRSCGATATRPAKPGARVAGMARSRSRSAGSRPRSPP